MKNMRRWFVVVAAISLVACLDGEDGVELDVGSGFEDARFDRLRARLAIEVRPGVDGYAGSDACNEELDETSPCCNTEFCSPRGFANQLVEGCDRDGPNDRDGSFCGLAVQSAEDRICAAQRLLQIIENPANQDIPATEGHTTGGFLVGPQDAESNSALALEAIRLAGMAQQIAGDALAFAAPTPAGPACAREDFALPAGVNAFADLTLGSELAHFYVEGLQVSEDAAALLGRSGAAVSDAELSRATDRAEAALMRNAPFASRTASAHGLIGGAHGLPALSGDRIEGLFDRAPLSGGGQQALVLLRTLALDPALLADTTIPLDELLVGGPSVPEGAPAFASVRYRLTRFFGEPELATASPADIYERIGVDSDALGEARAWIANENAAFDRPVRASGPRRARTLPVERLPDGTQSDFPLFTATRLPPPAASPAYWSSLVRFDPTPTLITDNPFSAPWRFRPNAQGALPPGATWGEETSSGGLAVVTRASGRTYASIREDAVLTAHYLLGLLRPLAADSVELREALIGMRETISGPLPDGLGGGEGESFRGRVRFCSWHYPRITPSMGFLMNIDLSVEGPSQSAGLAIVLGAEGLSCATEGTIDGSPCSAAELAGLEATPVLPLTPLGPGQFIVAMESAPGTGPRPELSSYFIVRRAPGASGPLMPGEFESLIGFIGEDDPDAPANSVACTGAPITPDLDSEVAALMGMLPDDPARSATNCVGLPEDMRLPLENELSRDSFPEESSWRHYIESARNSSLTADTLGDDLVRLGIEMDLRAERQADELERICGVRLNPTAFARELPPRITVPTGTACTEGYRYVAASDECVLDPIAWAMRVGALSDDDVARLEQCVGSDSTVEWAALGDQPICLWQTGTDATTLCEGSTAESPCPVVARGAMTDSDCVEYLPEDSMATAILVPERDALKFFSIPPLDEGGATGGEQVYPCEALSRIRARVARDGDLEEVLSSGLMRPDELALTTSRLGWVPSAGDYSRVTYGGSTVASTGSAGGTAGLWPNGQTMGGLNVFTNLCPGLALATDPADNTNGLFCVANVARGSDRPELREPRARANDLLARAVLAARFMTGLSLGDDMYVPYRPRVEGPAALPYASGMETRLLAPAFVEARTGSLWIDQTGDADFVGPLEFPFDRLDLIAEFVEGGVRDWQRCPYENSVCPAETGDYVDFDDTTNSGLPLMIHRVGDNRRSDAERARRAFFGTRTGDSTNHLGAYLRHLAGGGNLADLEDAHRGSLTQITTYFDLVFQVGFDIGHGCDGAAGCRCSQRPAACIEEYLDEDDVDILATYPGNQLHIQAPGGGLRPADFLNGLELSCMAARIQSSDPEFGCDEPLEVRSVGDLLQMNAYLECVADNIEERAGATVISDFPRSLLDALRGSGPTAVGTDSGELAAEVAALRGAFGELSVARIGIAGAIRRLAALIVQLRSAVTQSELTAQIEGLSLASTVWNQLTSCVVSIATIPASDGAASAGRALAAGATCINSVAQIGFASAITALRLDLLDDQLQAQISNFDVGANQQASDLETAAISIQTQIALVDAALARINTNRTAARRALNRALYLESDGADEHSAVSSVYRARRNTLLARYAEAHDRARRSAFIARLAVEQRLAMPLETITDDLATVEAPSEWVDELCTMPSIDYDVLSGIPGADGEPAPPLGPTGYAGSYVGDYVRRLEQVVESYSFVFPFREGTDTVVLSLRDDVFHVRAPCEVDVPNLLYQAERLDTLATDERPGWERYGCDPSAIPTSPGGVIDAHCVSARALTPDEEPVFFEPAGGGSDLGRPIGFSVRFGGSPAATPDTSLIQRVTLERGRYRLSWYGGPGTIENVYARTADGTHISTPTPWRTFPGGTWARYHVFFDVASTQEITIVIRPHWGPTPVDEGVELNFGGLMLEDVTTSVVGDVTRTIPDPTAPPATTTVGELNGPRPFFATGSTRTRVIQSCLDFTGDQFRADAWNPGCTRVCPDGYDAECDDRLATLRCYHQTSFSIDSDFISQSLTGTPTGFAAGNYNYRIDTLAVNIVGTGLRVCDGAPGCFGAGNFSYTFLHGSPYTVRNARGELYDAPLFPGRLESARALAAERYITNPISSADASLIGPYQRPDLAGRPLGGTLVLRIWDEPTLDFSRMEDVQVIVGYRYWQRQR